MMSVNKPNSGDTITKQSVIGMHDTIRTSINAVDDQFIGQSAFGVAQMSTSASPLVAFDNVNETGASSITMNTFGNNDASTDVIPNWQELAAYRLDNGGSGFVTTTPSQYVVFFTCRITVARDAGGNDMGPDPKVHAMFAITHEDNLGTETCIQTSIMGYGLYGIQPTSVVWKKQEIPVSIWCSFDFTSSKIIDRIKIYSCMLKGTASTIPTDIIIERGTSGVLVFERV
jgi:hypothetical protein